MIGLRALAAGATLSLFAGATLAADLPPEINLQEVSVKEARGWYVRGDAGYAFRTNRPNVSVRGYDPHIGADVTDGFDSSRFDGDFSGDLGVGYQFTDLLRADLTGDLFRGDFDSKYSGSRPCPGQAPGTSCDNKNSSSFRAAGLMANGYVDLGTLAGFTPYVGAGLGATHVKWGNSEMTSTCVDGSAGCGGAASSTDSYAGESSWRLTYALMAGVSYDIASNMKVDIGYRYSHIGGSDMFGTSDGTVSAASGSLQRHEIRIGLRITSW